jgi:hypothetical protein
MFSSLTQAYNETRRFITREAEALGAPRLDPFTVSIERNGVVIGNAGQPSLERYMAAAQQRLSREAFDFLSRRVQGFIAQNVCRVDPFKFMDQARAMRLPTHVQVGKSGAGVPSPETYVIGARATCGVIVSRPSIGRVEIPGFYPPGEAGPLPSRPSNPSEPSPPFVDPSDPTGPLPSNPGNGGGAGGSSLPWPLIAAGVFAALKLLR